MSDLYRVHGDNWANDSSVQDVPADVTQELKAVSHIIDEIHHFVFAIQDHKDKLANMLIEEMARIVYGSNEKARKGLDLEETLRYCKMIFEGVEELKYSDRYIFVRMSKAIRTKLTIYVLELKSTSRDWKSLFRLDLVPLNIILSEVVARSSSMQQHFIT